eukprot:12911465-Prorocentrum_lima.AAC.1
MVIVDSAVANTNFKVIEEHAVLTEHLISRTSRNIRGQDVQDGTPMTRTENTLAHSARYPYPREEM